MDVSFRAEIKKPRLRTDEASIFTINKFGGLVNKTIEGNAM